MARQSQSFVHYDCFVAVHLIVLLNAQFPADLFSILLASFTVSVPDAIVPDIPPLSEPSACGSTRSRKSKNGDGGPNICAGLREVNVTFPIGQEGSNWNDTDKLTAA